MRMKVAKNLTMVRTGGWNQSRRTPPATRPRGLTLILGLEKKICTFYFVVKVYMFDISWCRWCSREYNLTWTTWTSGILLSVTESIDAQALYIISRNTPSIFEWNVKYIFKAVDHPQIVKLRHLTHMMERLLSWTTCQSRVGAWWCSRESTTRVLICQRV